MAEINPIVFISYSHDSKDHQDRVLAFSNKLRSEGIDCNLDQYEVSPPEGWPKWMDKNVKKSDFVLIVCTQKYYDKVMGEDVKGLGIKWESTLIFQQLYNAGANNTKYIPVIFEEGRFEFIPEPLQGATFYNIDNQDDYNKLYWRLRGVKSEKPELGKLRELPARKRKTLFVSGLIDHEKWEKAKWMPGVSYCFSPEAPPIFTFYFDDLSLGKEIFAKLINIVGEEDKDERIRLSIIEGEVPKQDDGYFVTIGENINATGKIVDDLSTADVRYIAVGQRTQRMKPKTGSMNLNKFKEEFEKHGCYYIAPGKQLYDREQGYGAHIEMKYSILKKKIEFRNYNEIRDDNDPDVILKSLDVINHKF